MIITVFQMRHAFPIIKRLRDGARMFEFPPSTLARLRSQSSRLREADILGCSLIGLTAWAIRRINDKEKQPAHGLSPSLGNRS